MKSLIVLMFLACSANGQYLQCRSCNRATKLSDCNRLVACDATLEDCYMDELVTDQLTVVYNAGCRAKDVCSSVGNHGKRNDFISCSRCCSLSNDCNKRLCGIPDDTLSLAQCYSCDHRNSEQSEVKDPKSCVTLETCQDNEVCYTTQESLQGDNTFFFGCYSKQVCRIIMQQAYDDWRLCEKNLTQPDPGVSWTQACGSYHINIGKRSNAICHSCCNYGGCNYGTCHEQNDRLFNLVEQGKFDLNTLKFIV
ncbi:hypothetical protein ACF0H5_004349 [Mactra antiquata]